MSISDKMATGLRTYLWKILDCKRGTSGEPSRIELANLRGTGCLWLYDEVRGSLGRLWPRGTTASEYNRHQNNEEGFSR